MKKQHYYSALCLFAAALISSTIPAQNFEWAKTMGGGSGEFPRAIGIDAAGNVYTTGFFKGAADFDPGSPVYNLISNGSTDVFVSKLDADGNFVWALKMGGDTAETGYGMAVDASGNSYITGSFRDTVTSGTTELVSIAQDIFVCKIDADGNFLWAKSFAGTSDAEAEGISIALDADGNCYTTGYFKDSADFDPGAGVYYLNGGIPGDVFVSKLDVDGNFVWAKELGGNAADNGAGIQVDNNGDVCITGIFAQLADFDPGSGNASLSSTGQSDIFICKLDADGNYIWAKSFGGTGSDFGNALSVDGSGNIYTTGQYFSTVDFDPGSSTYDISSVGTWDIYLNKLDSDGNFVWAKSMGGPTGDEGFGMFADVNGYTYVAGKFHDTADYDPGPGIYELYSKGNYDISISKYDPDGNFLWAQSMGDTLVDYAYTVVADEAGNIYTTGTYDGTVDFEHGSGTTIFSSLGLGDMFILKYSELVTSAENAANTSSSAVHIFPNPANDIVSVNFSEHAALAFQCTIYTVSGQKMLSTELKQSSATINIAEFPAGIYMIEFSANAEKFYAKLVKQ